MVLEHVVLKSNPVFDVIDQMEQLAAAVEGIARGANEQAEYEAFLTAHRSQMRLTPDQQPASLCLD